jgi:hypothetical protein
VNTGFDPKGLPQDRGWLPSKLPARERVLGVSPSSRGRLLAVVVPEFVDQVQDKVPILT